MNIAIIGAGNMGSALAKAFVMKKVTDARSITLSDPDVEKLKRLEEELGTSTTSSNLSILDSDFLIIAVKPQSFPELAKEIGGKIAEKTVVISIMAGLSIGNIQKQLKHQKIIRSMPNTPAMINEGVTAWTASEEITATEKKIVQQLLESTGYAFEVKNEGEIARIGTIVGSGPGFAFYVIEQWLTATESLNLDPILRKTALLKVLKGSISLAEQAEESLEQLRKNVTSKGGFTEAGLAVLETGGLEELFKDMLTAAMLRTAELNGENVQKENLSKMNKVKSFNIWSAVKKETDYRQNTALFNERDVFWTKIGENIGHEQAGKGILSLRPVIIIKKFNQVIFLGCPLTTQNKKGSWYYDFHFSDQQSTAILSQARIFDARRLHSKMGTVAPDIHKKLLRKFKKLLR